VSQTFEWLNGAYAQRDGGLVDIKVDPLLIRSLNRSRTCAALALRAFQAQTGTAGVDFSAQV
jgi:hypothetical protein